MADLLNRVADALLALLALAVLGALCLFALLVPWWMTAAGAAALAAAWRANERRLRARRA